ncbi:hypothetical protein [Macrococcus animalis]|uniref:hypothetical protein n=1 Tax=Macrococcus animalis TaxID=3395467 RepID=UPI0039BDDFC3
MRKYEVMFSMISAIFGLIGLVILFVTNNIQLSKIFIYIGIIFIGLKVYITHKLLGAIVIMLFITLILMQMLISF